MKKKKPQYLRQLVGVRYCGIFYKEITSDLRAKRKKKKNNPFSMYGNFSEKLTYIIP